MSIGTIRFTSKIEIIKTISSQERVYPFATVTQDTIVDAVSNKELVLAASEADTELTNIEAIIILSESDFIVEVGGATGQTAITTKWFAYNGASASLFFTNPDAVDEITLEYITFIAT